jgi:hypothetical protein
MSHRENKLFALRGLRLICTSSIDALGDAIRPTRALFDTVGDEDTSAKPRVTQTQIKEKHLTFLLHQAYDNHNMAIARPIRVLGLVAIGLWIFFIYQVFGPTKYPKGPGDTLENMDRDPNLDRMHHDISLFAIGFTDTFCSYGRT